MPQSNAALKSRPSLVRPLPSAALTPICSPIILPSWLQACPSSAWFQLVARWLTVQALHLRQRERLGRLLWCKELTQRWRILCELTCLCRRLEHRVSKLEIENQGLQDVPSQGLIGALRNSGRKSLQTSSSCTLRTQPVFQSAGSRPRYYLRARHLAVPARRLFGCSSDKLS